MTLATTCSRTESSASRCARPAIPTPSRPASCPIRRGAGSAELAADGKGTLYPTEARRAQSLLRKSVTERDIPLALPHHLYPGFELLRALCVLCVSVLSVEIQFLEDEGVSSLRACAVRYTGAAMPIEPSDEELMLRYGSGDAAAFDLLYARHRGGVFRYLLRQCGSRTV